MGLGVQYTTRNNQLGNQIDDQARHAAFPGCQPSNDTLKHSSSLKFPKVLSCILFVAVVVHPFSQLIPAYKLRLLSVSVWLARIE